MKIKKITNLLSLFAVVALLSFGTTSCMSETSEVKKDIVVDEGATEKNESKCGEGKCGEGKCGGTEATEEKVDHFATVDTDNDGFISKEEFEVHGAVEFAEKDTDGDGSLTKEGCKMFDKFNTDGNDLLSKEEFVAGHSSMFAKLDSNGDSKITKEEMEAFMNNAHGETTEKAESKCGEGKTVETAKCGGGK
ncbi:MAG: EF-hand domain-containing protein [Bacteroidales bacterium]|nr:EF-hand domain-containing protein [Bacteroidales bacterium]